MFTEHGLRRCFNLTLGVCSSVEEQWPSKPLVAGSTPARRVKGALKVDGVDLDALFAMLSSAGFVLLGVQIHRVSSRLVIILERVVKKIRRSNDS